MKMYFTSSRKRLKFVLKISPPVTFCPSLFLFLTQANYTDPQSKLRFSTVEEFSYIRRLPSDVVTGYLALRKATSIVPWASEVETEWKWPLKQTDCTCDFVSWKQTFLLSIWKCQLWALERVSGFTRRSFQFAFFPSKCNLPSWIKSYFSCCL